jgi:hypothetical protein
MRQLYKQLAKDINFSNARTSEYTNKKCSIKPILKKRNRVYLLQKNIKTKRLSSKLDFKKIELFEILRKIGFINYKLQLLEESKLHLVFYVFLLELVRGDVLIVTSIDV